MKSKRRIYWAFMMVLTALTLIICGITITESAKVATLTLDQTVTYNAPEYIQVTFDAGNGEFSNSQHTYSTTIKISTLSGTSIFPSDPTLSGYTFAGWEYSVDGTNYSDYALASDMPFTEHLYVRAKWEEVTFTNPNYFTYSVTSGESTITGFDTSAITAASLTVADLTDIIFPEVDPNNNPIVAIGDNAFNGNSYIRSIVMPSTYTTVGQGSFKECSALRFVDLGGVSSIGNYSFSTRTIPTINSYTSPTVLQGNLIDVMIADNLTDVGLIDGVRNIFLPSTTIYCESSYDKYHYSSAWYDHDCVSSRKFVLDKNSFSLYMWNILGSHGGDASPLEEYTIDANGFCYATVAGAKTLVRYMGSGGNITIPSDVQRIESWVFKGVKLNSVTFANPNGWYANNTSINLSNSSNNAQYLMNTYLDSYWSIGKVTLVQQKYYNVSGLPSITVSCFNVTTSNDILVSSRGAVTACACRPVYTYVAQGTELTITLTLPNINSADYNPSSTLLYIGGVAYSVTANNQRTYTIGDIDYLIIFYHDDSYCFTSDTEVECWDEKRKRRYKKKVKDLKYSDLLIVWNFDEGKFDTAYPLWISKTKHATCYSETVFEDGKILRTVGSNETRRHRLFNMETGKFEYIGSNMKVGTRTFTVDGVETKVKSIRTVYKDVEYYNVISNYHMNLFTSGILTSCRLNNLYDVKDMKFVKDDRKLHSREDFADVSDRYFDGLRLAEQSLEINKETNDVKYDSLVAYAQHLEESAKEDKE